MTTETAKFVYSFLPVIKSWRSITEDAAEDLIQDALCKIIRLHDDRFEAMPDNEKRLFLMKTIWTIYLDKIRSRKRFRDGIRYLVAKVQPPEAYGIIELKDVRMSGKENMHCPYLFMHESGYSIKEIVALTGERQNTVLAHNRYARKFLNAHASE